MENDHDNNTDAIQAEPELKTFVPYTIEFDEHSGVLSGIIPERPVSPGNAQHIDIKTIDPEITKVSAFKIQQYLAAKHYDQFYLATNVIETFVRSIKRSHNGKIELGKRKNAEIKITTSKDKLSARAQTSQAWGGETLNQEKIDAAIAKAKLDPKLLIPEAIAKLMRSNVSLDLVIAEAIPPKNGDSASIEVLMKSKIIVDRNTDSLDAIDQHEVFDYTLVEQYEHLAIKTPATAGEDGLNVLGRPIKAKKGKDVKLPKLGGGVELSSDDKNIIVSSIKGHPVLSSSLVKVDPVLTIKEVGLDSGHIDYDGSVVITGKIRSGYDVKASGDIFVKGFVSKSKLSSGGGIYIQGGVQGDYSNEEHTTILVAKNDIELKFANQCKINSGGNIKVKEYLINCETLALGTITLGENAKRGAIIGGKAESYSGVHVKSLGSDAFIKTRLVLGVNTHAQKELEKYKNKKEQRLYESEKLKAILVKLRKTDTPSSVGRVTLDKERKIESTIEAIAKSIEEYDEQIEKLAAQVPDTQPLKLVVDRILFPNVEITINEATHTSKREYKNIRVEREGDAIEFKANT